MLGGLSFQCLEDASPRLTTPLLQDNKEDAPEEEPRVFELKRFGYHIVI
jgi:hypothetical protein